MPKPEKPFTWDPRKILFGGISFLFFVLLITSFFGKKGWIEIYRTRQRLTVLQAEVQDLTLRKQALARDIRELRTNPRAVEFKARQQLWMMDPDEIVIIR